MFYVRIATFAYSFRKEILTTLGILLMLILLPLLAIAGFVGSNASAVTDRLVEVNSVTHKIDVKDVHGNVVVSLDAATTWPVPGVVTLEFGASDLPYQSHHTGIDIANRHGKIGDPITPFMAGKVSNVVHDPIYGNYVIVDNGNNIRSLYYHMSETSTKVGADVKPGDVIGIEGMTGLATGPHVHFEIQVEGLPVNPRIFMVGDPPLGS